MPSDTGDRCYRDAVSDETPAEYRVTDAVGGIEWPGRQIAPGETFVGTECPSDLAPLIRDGAIVRVVTDEDLPAPSTEGSDGAPEGTGAAPLTTVVDPPTSAETPQVEGLTTVVDGSGTSTQTEPDTQPPTGTTVEQSEGAPVASSEV